MGAIIYPNESYAIMGACFNVYNTMGCGFLEAVYQECLSIEFEILQIASKPQTQLQLWYRDRKLQQEYRPDFLCYDKIIVELKAVCEIRDKHRAQVLNYLNASSLKLGLLVNFGQYPNLEYERIVL